MQELMHKSVAAEKFFRTLKNKICKYVTVKNMNIDKLNDIVEKCNSIYHRTKNIKSIDFNLVHILILKVMIKYQI